MKEDLRTMLSMIDAESRHWSVSASPTGFGGTTFTFGGPGMQRQYYRSGQPRASRTASGGGQPAQNPNLIWQLLPLLIIAFFYFISYMPSMLGPQEPSFTWAPSGRFRDQKMTSGRGVAFYVDKKEWAANDVVNGRVPGSAGGMNSGNVGLRRFEARVSASCF